MVRYTVLMLKRLLGIIIEFQNSHISDEERYSREIFYKNLVWVVNGDKFKKNFYIFHPLPNPKYNKAIDIMWFKSIKGQFRNRARNVLATV